MRTLTFLLMLNLMTPSLTGQGDRPDRTTISLPEPRLESDQSLEATLARRRSVREYEREATLRQGELGQLLWAAQGITSPRGFRTAPSAGALYPLEIYVVVGEVAELPAGVYQYQPQGHKLKWRQGGDLRRELAGLAVQQDWMAEAAMVLVIAGVYQRTMSKYGERGRRYVHIEVGHAAQNVYLQAEALGLATVAVGAFRDAAASELLGLRRSEQPLLLLPVGRKP